MNHDSENKLDHVVKQVNPGAGGGTVTISVMLAVADAPAAADWYKKALGATELWASARWHVCRLPVLPSSWVNPLVMDGNVRESWVSLLQE